MSSRTIEDLPSRIREALAEVRGVTEKKMFGGIAFFVNKKMLVTANNGRMMVRIDPEQEAAVLEKPGTRAVMMGGKRFKGFVHVEEEGMRTAKEFRRWIDLALEYNPEARRTKKKSEARNPKLETQRSKLKS